MGQIAKTRKYEVRTRRLTEEDLAKAKQLVAEDKVKGQVIEWRDKSCKGLVLRITPTTTQWYIRFREMSVKLETWMTVDYARKVADMTKTARRNGGDPKRFLANFLEKSREYADEEDAHLYASYFEDKNDPKAFEGTWNWGELVEHFLAEKLPDLKEKYRKQYASYLRHAAFDIIKDKGV